MKVALDMGNIISSLPSFGRWIYVLASSSFKKKTIGEGDIPYQEGDLFVIYYDKFREVIRKIHKCKSEDDQKSFYTSEKERIKDHSLHLQKYLRIYKGIYTNETLVIDLDGDDPPEREDIFADFLELATGMKFFRYY
jgi:hypothetical protein